MNILWIASHPHPNHTPHPVPWVTELGRKIAEEKVSLTIVTTNPNILTSQEVVHSNDYTNVFLRSPDNKNDFLTLYQKRIQILTNYLKNHEDRYDLLHIHGTEHQYEVSAHATRIPVVISIQGIISECVKFVRWSNYKQKLRWLLSAYYEKKYFSKNRYYFCRTHWDKKIIMAHNPNANILHNWEMIRDDFFKLEYDPNINKKCILFLGGSHELKGYEVFLRALDIVRKKYNITAIIASNTDTLKIRNFILKNKLKNVSIENLTILGFCDTAELIKAFRKSFCLVHPSLIDNSPNTVCEAQIAGLPVIASDVGGVGSLIEHNKTGMLTDLNPANVADNILQLYESRTLRETISQIAAKTARTRHNSKTIIRKTLCAYADLIDKHRTK